MRNLFNQAKVCTSCNRTAAVCFWYHLGKILSLCCSCAFEKAKKDEVKK